MKETSVPAEMDGEGAWVKEGGRELLLEWNMGVRGAGIEDESTELSRSWEGGRLATSPFAARAIC